MLNQLTTLQQIHQATQAYTELLITSVQTVSISLKFMSSALRTTGTMSPLGPETATLISQKSNLIWCRYRLELKSKLLQLSNLQDEMD